ncbi:hypothetical protein [Geomicrobium sp. JCM 19055]|uniref:hypothetical protein n=1 Tax=Geomicrobium sp. JCM 19055 TaxID=1460649 RepID=UPI002235A274|nr:hypothetical protein [Geomicrobium sp. JCM 19055]
MTRTFVLSYSRYTNKRFGEMRIVKRMQSFIRRTSIEEWAILVLFFVAVIAMLTVANIGF